jgi:hypothetical protein
VIALIATPIVMNVIEKAKKGAVEDSAYSYMGAIEYYVASTYNDDEVADYDLNSAFKDINLVKVKGTAPTGVNLQLENGKVKSGSISFNNYVAIISDGKVIEISTSQLSLVLNGDILINLAYGEEYTELEATATDVIDGDISSNIVKSGSVGSAVGSYTITYTVENSQGVVSTLTRTVNVVDLVKPAITVNGDISITINKGTTYTDAGATATDNADGDIMITDIVNNVDTSNVGTYTVTYTVSDSSGNTETATRTVEVTQPLYIDATGAPRPQVSSSMIPVKWNGSKWLKADVYSEWYNYGTKNWANAVLVTDASRTNYQSSVVGTEILEADVLAHLVWIPRYKYKIFKTGTTVVAAQAIEVVFEDNTVTKSNGTTKDSWLTHPAFTFGTTELNGYWVGKFETTGTTTNPTIKPYTATATGIVSLRSNNIATMFAISQKFSNTTTYGLTSSNDSHVAKNREWAGVTYLAHSTYGVGVTEIWPNINSEYKTGCTGTTSGASASTICKPYTDTSYGVNASTTGNITGVYDLVGGALELVMANNNSTPGPSSGFTSLPESKYYDSYTAGVDYITCGGVTCFGHGLYETRQWYGAQDKFFDNGKPWIIRGGGQGSGVSNSDFYTSVVDGASSTYFGFRTVILGG